MYWCEISFVNIKLGCSIYHTFKNVLAGRSQPHSPGWARVPLSLIFPQIPIIFSYFASKFPHFLPHFGSPGGQLTHPGRPWLRHCVLVSHKKWALTNCVPYYKFVLNLRGYCTSGPYFWRLCAFSQKIKQLRTKYPMDLVRNVLRNSKITVLLQ